MHERNVECFDKVFLSKIFMQNIIKKTTKPASKSSPHGLFVIVQSQFYYQIFHYKRKGEDDGEVARATCLGFRRKNAHVLCEVGCLMCVRELMMCTFTLGS